MTIGARITLGTAQFGLDYGVTNREGQVTEAAAGHILRHAAVLSIQWLDTAAAYGNAEVVLGHLAAQSKEFRIATKAAAGNADDPVALADGQFNTSLTRLCRERVDLLMIHHVQHLLGPQGAGLYRWLCEQRDSGRAAAIGASVYTPAEAFTLLERGWRFDWMQLPFNVLDQRALLDGALRRLQQAGVRIQVRSALLQGLLLANPAHVPPTLGAAVPWLQRMQDAARERGLSALQCALAFVAAQPAVDQIVLGVESVAQLDACVAAASAQIDVSDAVWRALACADVAVIDPRLWPAGVRLAA
jgi:aryl-alcohol dehydrogenase-like predicted oxidoreductase